MQEVLLTQSRVIAALILRETRVTFGTAQLGYLWAIANPALGVLVLVAIFSTVTPHPPLGTSFALFFSTGILLFEMNRKLAASIMTVFEANRGLMSYPLVKEIDVIVARFLLIVATFLLVMILFFSVLIISGEASLPARMDEVLLAIIVAAVLGLGNGLVNAVILGLWPTWRQVEGIISRPLFFISGIFFIPSFFSPELIAILSWNPILHTIEWMREGYYPNYQSIVLDKEYVLLFTAIMLAIGLAGERLFRKKLK